MRTFSKAQIDTLRQVYGKFVTIPVGIAEKLGKFLDTLPLPHLKQLEREDIRFVSPLARNRVIRAEMKK